MFNDHQKRFPHSADPQVAKANFDVNEKKSHDQDALRAHFLALRSKCKPGMLKHEETFLEQMGDESI